MGETKLNDSQLNESVDLTSEVTGILPVANGGTGSSTLDGAGLVTGPASATNNAVALYDGTTGKLIKNSTLVYTGGASPDLSGVNSVGGDAIPGSDFVGISDTQTLTNKNLTSGTNTFPTFNQNTTGSAATLTTGRTVQTNLASTSAATFNGSANITPGITGTLPVSHGGTGATTLTGYVKGNGTSAMTAVSTATAAADILAVAYPVGAIYISTLSTNPATLLGFGTWAAYATGQVLVGKASTGTFATAGATGGEETHLLTAAESGVPAHTHTYDKAGTSGGQYGLVDSGNSGSSGTQTTAANTAASATSAHNNLQPYIVVYMWNRTA